MKLKRRLIEDEDLKLMFAYCICITEENMFNNKSSEEEFEKRVRGLVASATQFISELVIVAACAVQLLLKEALSNSRGAICLLLIPLSLHQLPHQKIS
jgi:hypothetical protein